MRIIAIDPGYERLGIAVLEKSTREELIFSECFKTSASLPFTKRLLLLGEEVRRVIDEHGPSALAIENLFIATNQKTAMRVAETRGMILYIAEQEGLSVYEYTPLEIKTATTGYGKATKDQVIKMVQKIVPQAATLTQDDEMDAVAVGITHFAYQKYPS